MREIRTKEKASILPEKCFFWMIAVPQDVMRFSPRGARKKLAVTANALIKRAGAMNFSRNCELYSSHC